MRIFQTGKTKGVFHYNFTIDGRHRSTHVTEDKEYYNTIYNMIYQYRNNCNYKEALLNLNTQPTIIQETAKLIIKDELEDILYGQLI